MNVNINRHRSVMRRCQTLDTGRKLTTTGCESYMCFPFLNGDEVKIRETCKIIFTTTSPRILPLLLLLLLLYIHSLIRNKRGLTLPSCLMQQPEMEPRAVHENTQTKSYELLNSRKTSDVGLLLKIKQNKNVVIRRQA